jgi:hypothetical protein
MEELSDGICLIDSSMVTTVADYRKCAAVL